ncbi:PREDICTED: protein indeterminate-domain 11-like [Tarenaya hassleriana]|uniref:protein indeterminate-domain 11-like n=1 Tax=Tarenaya hassleriana TaxID=28532 RepID=UPI00053C4165|nr:PREDICTED: protein indeterminate-domain 11-like [Tarenaya hassleriana]XP_010552211.1 PREDICTED: protein indeterminate-domain 11-like [Tarenaya hassleriana]XP_010552212.1 PREDICTED: protein indeterminate-domain 11-like [Tarenaya hassleriana]XP_010552213.1 PREDICTED: protein indeterminate-domain 11-like [Tarenaya hassleriana]
MDEMMNEDMPFHQHHRQQQQVIAEENMSNLTSASGDHQASVSSGNRTEANGSNFVNQQQQQQQCFVPQLQAQSSQPPKKKRNQPGNPDPEAEVIALSPKTLMATNRFICDICNKGFQRDQNLQLHRRGHNLPWKLKQRSKTEAVRKKVYVCPEASCVHHEPSRALGDLTGIKKHFCRKHGEKKWKCDKCSKRYAVQSDCKAHFKTCGTREYRCDCGTLFSRRDSFITHRAFCDALAEESERANPTHQPNPISIQSSYQTPQPNNPPPSYNNVVSNSGSSNNSNNLHGFSMKKEQEIDINFTHPPWLSPPPFPCSKAETPSVVFPSNPNPSFAAAGALFPSFHRPSPPSPALSATALLQRAAQMGATTTTPSPAEEIRSSSSHALKTTMAAVMTSPYPASGFGFSASGNADNPSMFQGYNTMNPAAGFEAFDESFGGFLRANATTAAASVAPAVGEKYGGGRGIGEGLTRDFLGLTPLSHSEILSFSDLGDCFSGNASEQQQRRDHSQNP